MGINLLYQALQQGNGADTSYKDSQEYKSLELQKKAAQLDQDRLELESIKPPPEQPSPYARPGEEAIAGLLALALQGMGGGQGDQFQNAFRQGIVSRRNTAYNNQLAEQQRQQQLAAIKAQQAGRKVGVLEGEMTQIARDAQLEREYSYKTEKDRDAAREKANLEDWDKYQYGVKNGITGQAESFGRKLAARGLITSDQLKADLADAKVNANARKVKAVSGEVDSFNKKIASFDKWNKGYVTASQKKQLEDYWVKSVMPRYKDYGVTKDDMPPINDEKTLMSQYAEEALVEIRTKLKYLDAKEAQELANLQAFIRLREAGIAASIQNAQTMAGGLGLRERQFAWDMKKDQAEIDLKKGEYDKKLEEKLIPMRAERKALRTQLDMLTKEYDFDKMSGDAKKVYFKLAAIEEKIKSFEDEKISKTPSMWNRMVDAVRPSQKLSEGTMRGVSDLSVE